MGRKKLTPLEKLYYSRVEKLVLLGVWIGKSGTNCTDKDAIICMCNHMGIEVDNNVLNDMWRKLISAQDEFREVLRHIKQSERSVSGE